MSNSFQTVGIKQNVRVEELEGFYRIHFKSSKAGVNNPLANGQLVPLQLICGTLGGFLTIMGGIVDHNFGSFLAGLLLASPFLLFIHLRRPIWNWLDVYPGQGIKVGDKSIAHNVIDSFYTQRRAAGSGFYAAAKVTGTDVPLTGLCTQEVAESVNTKVIQALNS
ncbi:MULTISPECIES: hypothetical protein [Deefgea]|uniref:Uncharacterized protein n=1 Tax=Deefgea chitinilytica TaxID=570276 RepID=A0ABS2CBP5_9NEIS|nr:MULTISPECIES: hypothetical protein [Deefgea]MBM5571577.1 hypothetical protein [Deefgea chitinilytica]MBM9888812.1 hypothetical protein [Deefgea sp. CFH1-16]